MHTETEHARVDGGAVVDGAIHDRVGADLFGELFAGEGPIIRTDEREVHAHPAVGDEIPPCHLVGAAGGAHADADGHDLGIRHVAARKLHPYIRIGRILFAVEQIRLHGAFFAGERVEPPRLDAAVQDERKQHLEGLGLAGTVRSAQDQPPVGETEFLVAVVPQVDDAGASGNEADTIVNEVHGSVRRLS